MDEILLVDNDPNRRNNLASRLRMQGYDVMLATGGFHAVHLIEKSSFLSMIILGNMSDMSGIEILGLCRTNIDKNKLPVVYIDKKLSQEEVLEVFENGANDFIVYSPNIFNSIVEKLKKYKSLKSKAGKSKT